MLTANLKQNPDTIISTLVDAFATAKSGMSERLKTLGIEDATDFATSVGYLIAGSYGIAMVLNLTALY